ncbi:class I SAM-dependent rRNA methyltransferase [Hallella bergensis]|uniref:class I SAM-dependent rRNA methyltransferase n=1 Tax=Hallella bergensis TaxID=242750 RepID=UPI003990A039
MMTETYKKIYLKRGKEESLLRFHPWIFSGAIHHADEGIAEGETVRVITSEGKIIAVGHYQIGTITVRVLSFSDVLIDDDFWKQRLNAALQMRQRIGVVDNPQNDTYRLVHGEGDGLPGLIVDCYGPTAVMQAHSVGMHVCREQICKALVDVMGGRIAQVYYKSETTLPFKSGLGQEDGFLYGSTDNNLAMENGLQFNIDWLRGQKTGFFVDQRENRSLLEHYAKDKTILNMFCYTGGFSVYAMRGDAKLVHSVDSSAKAVELTNRNVELNFPGDSRHEAFCDDAFKYLDANDNKYDLIVLDPPAFAKHRGVLRNALKGYTRLNARGLERIKHGGILFTFSCSQVVTKDQFRNAVFTAAAQTGRKVRILHQLHQPADHPINIYHPEGEYLKGLVLYVE